MRKVTVIAALFGVMIPAAADDYVPRDTQKEGDNPPSPEQAAQLLSVPDGFKVTLFAGEPDVRQPISMTLDDRGRLWVAESYSYKEWEKKPKDRILIFEDSDQDGQFDRRTIFWDKGEHVSSVEVGFGGVWVIDVPDLLFIPDRDGDDVPDGEPEVKLTGFTLKASHNMANGLRWGPDGWLYGRHGVLAQSSVDHPQSTPKFGTRQQFDCAIWRVRPDARGWNGGGPDVVCRGMTNPWGLDWNENGDLFASGNVNGHLWHIIDGGLYDRMFGQGTAPHAYQRLKPCADHQHHIGDWGNWTKARSADGKGVHANFGGGHSHCGLMIYRGDDWPEAYRGRAFLCNVHGRRVNAERLERSGSGYVARHEEDFLLADNPWFKGVEMIYGPDGGVYLSDWCDYGECHDSDGVHRSSGRIYKITYGPPNQVPAELGDLSKLESRRLVGLQTHPNAFFSSHARRLLQERFGTRQDIHRRDLIIGDRAARDAASAALRREMELFDKLVEQAWSIATNEDASLGHRTNALWALQGMGGLEQGHYETLHANANDIIASWALKQFNPGAFRLGEFIDSGKTTPGMRLAMLTNMDRLPPKEFFAVASKLAQFSKDADDANLPLMLWYRIAPHVPIRPELALKLAAASEIPLLTIFIARRMAHEERLLELLLHWLPGQAVARQELALRGMADGLAALGEVNKPQSWDAYSRKAPKELATLIARLNRLFDTPPQPQLEELFASLSDNGSRNGAIRSLGKFDDPRVSQRLISMFPNVVKKDQAAALNVLTSRATHAAALLEAIESGEFSRADLDAFHARQIEALGEAALSERLATAWGSVRAPSEAKQAQIAAWKAKLTTAELKKGDRRKGRRLFQRSCSACHVLFGEGQKIGPELTGGNRGDLHYLLENIIDPNALLPEDYRMTVLKLKDGRTVSGSITARTGRSTTIQTATEQIVVAKETIAKQDTLPVSTMPEGLLQGMEDQEVRDLIAYLQGRDPVELPVSD